MNRSATAAAVVCIFASLFLVADLPAQVNVTTYHNDNTRSGLNPQETTLTPTNVNSSQFGKLFSVSLDGYVYAQPLYLSNVSINGGTHNVLYVATEHDSLYAIDADSGTIYWQQSFINAAAGVTTASSSDVSCTDLVPEVGITGTPAIDTSTGTIYLIAKTKENGAFVQRLHAIDTVTHAEKFGGPVVIQASVPGNGDGSTNGVVSFDPLKEHSRPGVLLENGHVVVAWASHCDNGPYHGWVMSYSASTLAQEAVFNTSPNGGLSGVWMSGDGVAADSSGNLFFATGNGTYDGVTNYGDSIVKLGPPSGGSFPILDWFTPYNQSSLSGGDTDVASGGLLLLPDMPSGVPHTHQLVQMGKEGKLYEVDRDNMGKFCSTCTSVDTNIIQEVPGATTGVWGGPSYWNNNVYWGGGNDGGSADNLKAFTVNLNNTGFLSTTPSSKSSKQFSFATGTPVVSSNGNTNGIVWLLDNSAFASSCCQALYAYDATNLNNMLYNSTQAANNRDVPGGAVKFSAPTIANGKVYVGGQALVTAYGIISTTPGAAAPTFSPAAGSYTTATTVTLSDTTAGAAIHCTTNGSTPTASSPVCTSVTVSGTTTINAIAVASGYTNSAVATATYDIDPGASGINYGAGLSATGLVLNSSAAMNGTRLRLTNTGTNEAGSAWSSAPINVQTFTTDFSFQLSSASADGFTFAIQGIGTTALGPSGGGLGYGPDTPGGTPGIANSVAVKFDIYSNAGEGTDSTGLYTDGASPTTPAVDMTSSGVVLLSGDIFNVHMTYDGTTLKWTVTDAFNPSETFSTSQAINIPSTVGGNTAYVGFTGGTGGETAIQEIINWTYVSSLPVVATPVFTPVAGVYNPGQQVTLADSTAGAAIFYTIGGTTTQYTAPIVVNSTTTISAYATLSGALNSATANATYTINSTGNPYVNYATGFSTTGLAFNGSTKLNGTRLRLTDGGASEAASAWYTTPVNVQSFTSDFSFQLTNPNADGFAFVIQNAGLTALGPLGGGLGYGPDAPGGTPGIPTSVAVKFDLYNNAGEGTNSTGLYTDGASPTTPATTLAGGVNLHSGDVFNAHVTYNGTTLTLTITDATTPTETFTTSWTVNIPATVGANTAFVGFTAGTGGSTATQEIIGWTYTSGAPAATVYEATKLPVTGSPNTRVFTWGGLPDKSAVIADGTKVGAFLSFTVNVAQPGTYDIRFGSKQYVTRAMVQLSVNGTNVGAPIDEYSSNGAGVFQELDAGTLTFGAAGNYTFKLTAVSKNAASSGYTVETDYFKLTPQ
jgi:Legume lectin domain/Chitobiase/beta-hexosaminidase C-terminal domain